jgi:hypothetical protein
MDNTFRIKTFKLSDMVENPSIVMVAKRGSGKSFVTKAIMEELKDIPVGIVISPTDSNSKFFAKFFPETFVYHKYDSNILEKLLFRQEQMLDKNEQYNKKGKKIDTRAMLVMDDCLASKGSWTNDQEIAEIFFNGRHKHLTYILTMQTPLGLKPEFRTNFDYVFLLADDVKSNLKKLYIHYAGMFDNLQAFIAVFNEVTKDFGCLVIINRGARESLDDKIGWYKAPNLRKKEIVWGCKKFRRFHQKFFNENWKKDQTRKKYEHLRNNIPGGRKSKNNFCIKKMNDT